MRGIEDKGRSEGVGYEPVEDGISTDDPHVSGKAASRKVESKVLTHSGNGSRQTDVFHIIWNVHPRFHG